jgi:tRNA (guanine10-N2)-dimethyltransferase
MKLLFELSQEHPELPKAEVLACLDAEGIKYSVSDYNINGLITVEAELEPNDPVLNVLSDRLALCFSITHGLYSTDDFSKVEAFVKNFKLEADNAFCVTAKRIGNFHSTLILPDIERKVGAILSQKYKVDLDKPDKEIKVIVAEQIHFGVNVGNIDRKSFEARVPQNRPFFSPVSLHPKFARALVNLARLRAGDLLLDPFCGTGGIMIEAGLIGMEIVGCDLDQDMVNGSQDNLEWAGLSNFSIFQSDVGELEKVVQEPGQVDAIVTEPPYGRAASTGGESLQELFERSFSSFHTILPKGKYLIISIPGKEFIDMATEYFEIHELFSMRIHRSLVKHFCVFINK